MKTFSKLRQFDQWMSENISGSWLIYGLILLGVIARLLPHPPNFTPIAALALFGGTYLSRRYAAFTVLGAMLISDLFLGFHTTMVYVYGSFLLAVFIGFWLRRHLSIINAIGASLLGSILFFLITNFGVWLHSGMYPHTFTGLLESYIMGIPFYRGMPDGQAFMFLRNTVFGDLFFTGVFFGLYEVYKHLTERRVVWQRASN